MTHLLPVVLAGFLGAVSLLADDDPTLTFYVQLVRGTDAVSADNPRWRPVGPKLNKALHRVFRWANYWEVSRGKLKVGQAKVIKGRVTPERDVEIELIDGQTMEVRLYQDGRLSRAARQPISQMCILGGDRQKDEAWFIVVRRDKPL